MKKKLEENITGAELFKELKDVVIDDKVNQRKRNPFSIENEKRVDLDMIFKRNCAAATTSDGEPNNHSFRRKLIELKKSSESFETFLISETSDYDN